jgi:hypothetical protein
MTDPAKQLSVEHLEFLTKAAISRDVALAAGIYTAAKLSQLPQGRGGRRRSERCGLLSRSGQQGRRSVRADRWSASVFR